MDQINCIPFLHAIEKLKYNKPTCWRSLGIHSFESAADHMWDTWAVLLAHAQEYSSLDRCMLMSLLHAITDFTPTEGKGEKEQLAKDYLHCLLKTTTNATLAYEFDELWSEYKLGESDVAKRVRDACACAYALQDGNSGGISRTGKELFQLQEFVLSRDLRSFIGLLEDEIKAPDKTESATMMKAIIVGNNYWDTPSQSLDLVSKSMDTIPSTSTLPFLRLTQLLPKTDRAGWVRRGIDSSEVEKVSSHSWRMAIVGWMLVPQTVVGDVTPNDGILRDDKQTHERQAQDLLVYTLQAPNPYAASLLRRLLTTFEEGKELVAKVSHDIDSLECLAQAVEYARRYKNIKTIEEDFLAPEPKMHSPDLQRLAMLLPQELATSLDRREDICVIFVLGGPGVGKGTQCKQLAREHGFYHISVGELLDKPSPFAQFIINSKQKYVIIPAQLTVSLLQDEMLRGISEGKKVFLIDGFPRSVDQASYFDEIISEHYSIILLDCSEVVMTERLFARAEAGVKAGKSRVDDNSTTIPNRVKGFREKNGPVEKYFQQHKHEAIQTIQCGGSTDEVYSEFKLVVLEKVLRLGKRV